jgi:hypothetical protein
MKREDGRGFRKGLPPLRRVAVRHLQVLDENTGQADRLSYGAVPKI